MIVFSDMDGTLLTSDKQMSDATWAMLDELAHRSIEFVPCTGRPLSGIFEPILAHPAVHYAVCANGASVWQLDEDTPTDASRATCILSRPLDRGIAHRIHRIAAGHDVTFDIFADGQCFLPRSLYTRLDEFCGGDPHIAASLKRTRTPIDMDIDARSTRSRRSNASPCTGTTRPIATPSRRSSTRSEALRSHVRTP